METFWAVHMRRPNAMTAKELPLAERKARVAALVKSGKLTKEQAKLIDFRAPPPAVREFAQTLAGRAREALARGKRAAA